MSMPSPPSGPAHARAPLPWIAGAGLAFALALLRDAWVAEDALITFRSIHHWVNGYGLRFNVDERVQSFTHPLWLLVNAAVYLSSREVLWTVTATGLVGCLGAWLLLVGARGPRPVLVLLAITAAWAGSWSVWSYSGSGFENPLTFLLLAAFHVLLRRADADRVPWLGLSLAAALLALNRLDTSLFALPPLAGLLLRERRRLRLAPLVLGMVPLGAWLSFALLYYGFAFPNTGPAKLSGALPTSLYVDSGLRYLAEFLWRDPVGAGLLVAGLGVGVHDAAAWARGRGGAAQARRALLAAGIGLYLAYVVRVGGCFLSGRFLAAPVLVAVALLAELLPGVFDPVPPRVHLRRALLGALFLTVMGASWTLVGPIGEASRVRGRPAARAWLDEDLRWRFSTEARAFRERGNEARRAAKRGQRVSPQHAIGFTGMAAGPRVMILDRFGLADPLLARLPPEPDPRFLAGHLKRAVPKGYVHARETGDLSQMDPALAAYYARLRLVVSGPLLDPERLRAVRDIQLGRLRPPPLPAADDAGEGSPP